MKWLLPAILLALPAGAQLRPVPVHSAAGTLSPAQTDAAIEAIIAAIERQYVFPDRVPAIVQAVRAAQASGRYRTSDPAVFSARLTEDISRAGNDGHLYLQYDPQRFAAASAPQSSGAPTEGGLDAVLAARARRTNYGLSETRLLPGNIRYLRISAFDWVEDEAGQAYDDAMRFLRGGDAVIIDIRGNGGGSHEAVRYALSHFMPSGRLLMTFLEAGKEPEQSHTLSNLPAGRMIGKPLYVLIDGGVGSAAEDFAYSVQQFKLGRLVGGSTAGGANNNRFVPIPPGFMLSVSFGRPVHAVSGGNWEGTGVAPDTRTPGPSALDAAERQALDDLLARAGSDDERRAEYEWAQVGVEARLQPVTLDAAALRSRAGSYGDAVIAYRDGALWLKTRPSAPVRRMVPLTPDGRLFALEGHEMLRARFAGRDLEMLWRGEPAPRVYPRSR
ncbi:S41 family peptidase [Sphingomonas sp.]|uniref:S41 family peptidase n=1 Tax=Sphingomonas sp. TaxID=28214 RepID=UPI0031D02698